MPDNKKVTVQNEVKIEQKGVQNEILFSIKELIVQIIQNTIAPALQDMGYNAFDQVSRTLFHQGVNRNNSSNRSSNGTYNYSKAWNNAQQGNAVFVGDKFSIDNIVFQTRGDAESTLRGLQNILNSDGVVRVSALYEMIGQSNVSYTCNSYGWTNLNGVRVMRTVSGGWIIQLPDPMPLKY